MLRGIFKRKKKRLEPNVDYPGHIDFLGGRHASIKDYIEYVKNNPEERKKLESLFEDLSVIENNQKRNCDIDLKEANERFCHGDHISDDELELILDSYKKVLELIELLNYRNEFDLIRKELDERKRRLEDYKFYREKNEKNSKYSDSEHCFQ